MNRAKVLEFFDASTIEDQVNVIGCGAIGSHVCETLARMGFETVHIYDFDTVSDHNITNQKFIANDIDTLKVDACEKYMQAINPEIKVIKHPEGLQEPYVVNGIVILAVDDIELRQKIVQANEYNKFCSIIMDFRMRLTDAQHYFATTSNKTDMIKLKRSMNFTHDEAKEATPESACGVQLSVVYTVQTIVSLGIANLVNELVSKTHNTFIMMDMAHMNITVF